MILLHEIRAEEQTQSRAFLVLGAEGAEMGVGMEQFLLTHLTDATAVVLLAVIIVINALSELAAKKLGGGKTDE